MARKHPKHGPYGDLHREEPETQAAAVSCWLCSRPTGKTIVWHHPVPKSRGGRNVVPMHPICQQTLIANFTNSELQRHAMDVDALLETPTCANLSIEWRKRTPISPPPQQKSRGDQLAPSASTNFQIAKTVGQLLNRSSANLGSVAERRKLPCGIIKPEWQLMAQFATLILRHSLYRLFIV